MKKELNYKQLLEEIDSNPDMITITETISLDVQRTPFESDTEQNRSAIFNILRATAYKQPTINYCQGMNYIAAFVLKFTNDEEEAFFFLLGLISYTDYGNIFTNDLEKLKQMFYVFDRLLFIYMPELHFYLKSNGVSPSYYVAPWFITLFTNSFQYVTESENPKLIVRVIDEFLLV